MDIRQLKPAKEFALRYGVKALVHGAPGTGKTPIFNTAPRPLLLICEPGMNSMRNSTIPSWLGNTPETIDDFFKWLFGSNERRNFDTIGVDSVSEMANIYLEDAKRRVSHGLKQYGIMAERVLGHMNNLFFLQQMHTYLICKQGIEEIVTATGSTTRYVPGFPGKELNREIPHKYDEILHLGPKNVPGAGFVKAFQCSGSIDVLARDRSGMLNEFEPPDLTALFNKCMS